MKIPSKLLILLFLFAFNPKLFPQKIVEHYMPVKKDSLRIGKGNDDFLPYIQSGFTLMIPKDKTVNGVLIFLESSGYDKKNNSAKQLYNEASEKGFAVLSVSSEIPFDFYFSDQSILSTHALIKKAFSKYVLPNENVFFLGAGLIGHRALKYLEYMQLGNYEFRLNTRGIILCNLTLDWTRKWHQHERDIRINRINLWEPTFINYMLETHLKGTPNSVPENYHQFSSYSYADDKNRNIGVYEDYAIRAYIEPSIKYRLKKYFRTLYENNATDMVGFIAELELNGNKNTELVILPSDENLVKGRSAQSTWQSINKKELMEWIVKEAIN